NVGPGLVVGALAAVLVRVDPRPEPGRVGGKRGQELVGEAGRGRVGAALGRHRQPGGAQAAGGRRGAPGEAFVPHRVVPLYPPPRGLWLSAGPQTRRRSAVSQLRLPPPSVIDNPADVTRMYCPGRGNGWPELLTARAARFST